MSSLRIFLLLSLVSFCANAKADIVVVVHVENPLNSISIEEVRDIFLGKKRVFNTQNKVKPVNLPYGETRSTFEMQLLGLNKAELTRYWSRKAFSGKQAPPLKVNSAEEMLMKVSSDVARIGYLDAKDADQRVKVIFRLETTNKNEAS